jgi:hypothetical protein
MWALTGRLEPTAAVIAFTALQLDVFLTPQLLNPSTLLQQLLHQPCLPSCCCTVERIAVVMLAAVKVLRVHQHVANIPELGHSSFAQWTGNAGVADEPPCQHSWVLPDRGSSLAGGEWSCCVAEDDSLQVVWEVR